MADDLVYNIEALKYMIMKVGVSVEDNVHMALNGHQALAQVKA